MARLCRHRGVEFHLLNSGTTKLVGEESANIGFRGVDWDICKEETPFCVCSGMGGLVLFYVEIVLRVGVLLWKAGKCGEGEREDCEV